MPQQPVVPDRYALIGHPVAHSRSPMIHALFAQQTAQALTYELIDAPPERFAATVREFAAAGGRGMNVTVPHKEAAFAIADQVGDEAALAKAVNTLSFAGGAIRGDNTDGLGFIRDVTQHEHERIIGAHVLVLGAGGAVRGILGPLLKTRPAALMLANRTAARAETLAEEFASLGGIDVCEFPALAGRGAFDIVVNATSAGLHGEQPPFPASIIGPHTFAYDLAYAAQPTPFVAWAASLGARRAVQGWGMLIEQAAESFRIWRGVRPDTAAVRGQLML